MKKLFAILLCVGLMLSVVACAPATTNDPTTPPATEPEVTLRKIDLTDSIVGVDSQDSATQTDYTKLTWYSVKTPDWGVNEQLFMVTDGDYTNGIGWGLDPHERADLYIDLTANTGAAVDVKQFKLYHSKDQDVPSVVFALVLEDGTVVENTATLDWKSGTDVDPFVFDYDKTYKAVGLYVWENQNTARAAFGEIELWQIDDGTPAPTPVETEYKLGMGIVVSTASSKTGLAQVDATVATVVTDKDGKIVAARIDVAQNKFDLTADFATETAKTFETKMELGDRYGMGPVGIDNDGNGVTLEWFEQAKAFETYIVGKTGAEVAALELQEAGGHQIAVDQTLLDAGCSMQITDFMTAVEKACKDEQGVTFKTAKKFTLGVAATTTAAESTAATADAAAAIKMYTDFGATVVAGGKIIAALNDAIQPTIAANAAGEIGEVTYNATKRELKEEYGMAPAVNYGMDWNGDGKVLEWYLQSAEFSKYVVGKTAAEVEAIATKEVEGKGYIIAADEALLTAGCTIQITSIKTVVAQAAKNAR